MIYITGDKHRDFTFLMKFCTENNTTYDDILIILGDAGINFYGKWKDRKVKKQIAKYPITLFCIHGNHDKRPTNCEEYQEVKWHNGIVYQEDEFPSILFAKDGEIYDFNGKQVFVIGGAASADMQYRLMYDIPWFPDEKPSAEIKAHAELVLREKDYKIDYVFSHSVPFRFFSLLQIKEEGREIETEKWLQMLEDKLTYKMWYAGHFHCDRQIERLRIMYNDIDVLQ